MNPQQAKTLIIDCGTMVGHQQTELELAQDAVPFFDLVVGQADYLGMRLSNGIWASFRAIYRSDNGMWRIEFSDAVPEIHAGIFPVVDGQRQRRSDHAAVFTRIGVGTAPDYDLQFLQIGSEEYNAHLARADAVGEKHRTQEGGHGRNYGWY